MAGTRLPTGCYLSIASPPSRDAASGFTMYGWFYVPTFAAGDYHTTMILNYVTNDVGEGFQFEASSTTTADGFIMCYPLDYASIGGTYTAGVWYWFAEVFTRDGGVTTRRTYVTATAGTTPTLIATETWTVADANPEWWDIGYARGFARELRGTFEYAGVVASALSLAQMAAQSNSATPLVAAWAFISGLNGDITDTSGNGRTVVVTNGPVEVSSVEAPLTAVPVSVAVAARSAGATASLSAHVQGPVAVAVAGRAAGAVAALTANVAHPISVGVAARAAGATASLSAHVQGPVAVAVAGRAAGAVASISAHVAHPTSVAVAARAAGAVASISAQVVQPKVVILYGHSVIAGYGISDPAQHIAPQLATLLGSRVESVVELGYSGESSASLDSNFNARVAPYIVVGQETIVVYTICFNSANNGVSATDIMANVWSIAAKARALGCKSLVMTETKAIPSMQAHEDTLLDINAQMRADWPSHNEGVVDTRQRFYNPLDLTIYQVDGAHPNGTGDGVLASMIYGETNRLLLGASYSKSLATGARAAGAVASLTATVQTQVTSIDTAVNATLPALTGQVTGHVAQSVETAVGATLPALTASITGEVYQALSIDTAVNATLPALTGQVTGHVAQSVETAVGATLPALTASITGTVAQFDPPVASTTTGKPTPYMARRAILVQPGDVVPLPQWVRKFDALPPCSVIVRDRSGVPLSGALVGPVLKGASLSSCAVVSAGLILLEY